MKDEKLFEKIGMTVRKKSVFYIFAVAFLFILHPSSFILAQTCDSLQFCSFKAITITVTSGKTAQYVDVDTSYRIRNIDTAITFEVWMKPQLQPGKRAYIGGIWGPNKDNNDVWVCYIADTKIYFALSAPNSYLGDQDNTFAIADIPNLYTRGWVHIACVWDGISQQARILVDGVEVARTRNAAFPISRLHHQESAKLPLEIGSSNALLDDSLVNRAFKGQIDEVRLWKRALSNVEISCQRNQSLNGNEKDLELYYRANDSSYVLTLCDATGNGHTGLMRSGARMYPSDRTVPATFTLAPNTVTATLICQNDTDITFTLLDTSFCGNSLIGYVYYGYSSLFTVSQSTFNTQQGVAITFKLHFHGDLTGALWTYLYIQNTNRCGDYLQIPIIVNRSTELTYDKTDILFDTLFVGCPEHSYTEDSLKICNQSGRPIKIYSINNKNPKFSWKPVTTNLPITLQPGECWSVIVRMDANDTTKTLYDTLHVISDDKCPGSGYIPIQGRTQDVFVLLTPNAKSQIHKMTFEAVCPGQLSNVQDYQFRSLMNDNVFIDTMIFTTPEFFGRKFAFPIRLKPKTAYNLEFIRFRPSAPGPFVGQIQVISHYRGCTITKTIDFTGTGISVDVAFLTPNVLFGNITIGKVGNQTATVKNTGTDPRNMSSYLKVGDVFSITGGKSFGIGPGQTANIQLQFRPREKKTYYDTLCIFDLQCYGTICIPISGTGVFEQLEFVPPFMNIANVLGCECRSDSISVRNISGTGVTITSDALIDPSGKFTLLNRIPTGPFANNSTFIYDVKYCPNDVISDRADRSYIQINLSDGTNYQILLQGTSMIPKLAVTTLTTYGPVEVGWQKNDSITIENISAVPVHVTTVTPPPGYTLISTTPPLPFWLDPRDSITAYIQFKPTAAQNYIGNVVVVLDTPCGKQTTGVLSGVGVILKLDVPIQLINYGLVKPCDCQEREIPLTNRSNFIPMNIDSIWIDDVGLQNPNATVFSWRSKLTGKTSGSFIIPPNTEDTLVVIFCPNIPAILKNLTMNAQIHIKAHTPAWSQQFNTFLSGRREMNFQPNNVIVQFPPTRVDINAQSIRVRVIVPDAFLNPSGDSIVFTGATFVPDQRVFTVAECSGKMLPWIVRRGDTLCLVINFHPRAPKKYVARLNLFTSFPCDGVDTSILVTGEGFAPAYGLEVAFDTSRANGQDTFHITTCDTLVIPIMIDKDMPQNIIDLLFHLGYDSTKLRFLNVQTPYTNQPIAVDTGDGTWVDLKNARDVKAGYLAYVRFIPKGDTANFALTLDNIDFDSDSLVSFKFVTGVDTCRILIDNPEVSISKLTDFDTVLVKQCKDLTLVVRNPGLVPMRFDSLSSLPLFHTIVSADKAYPLIMQPGDSIIFTIRFCPRADSLIDTSIFAYSNFPCPIVDTGRIHSYGFAPPYPIILSFDPRIGIVDTIGGTIGDTVTVPIIIDRDMPLTPIDIKYTLTYDKYALQYLGIKSKYSTPTVANKPGKLDIDMFKCDSIVAGEIASLKFLMEVPDSVISSIVLIPRKFSSDSIMFIKPVPTGDTSSVKIGPKCTISYLVFTGGTNSFANPRPNPTTGRVETEVQFFEDVNPKFTIYSTTGAKVMDILDGSAAMKGGRYKLDFDVSHLAAGAYILVFEAGEFRATKQIVVRK